jgi:4-hydroxybenzoate polyprenyltransferase
MKTKNWLVFIVERFEPVSHLTLIGLLFVAHVVLIDVGTVHEHQSGECSAFNWCGLFLGSVAFFFMLRLYDELKDAEVDARLNPTRPLPRGLLRRRDLYAGIAVCIAVELFTFATAGPPALAGIIAAILYSLLMFQEFFIGRWLRPKLTAYAVSHTVVIVLLSIALFAALSGRWPWKLGWSEYAFAICNWCLFNIFEFGRKSFVSREERDGVPSYSSLFGRSGAVALAVGMAIAATLLAGSMQLPASVSLRVLLIVLNLLFAAIGLAYIAHDSVFMGRIYRGSATLYMVLFFSGFVFDWAFTESSSYVSHP